MRRNRRARRKRRTTTIKPNDIRKSLKLPIAREKS
nr:MAG TPA: hypothetical protein [Caudoviricetes sp.]DAW04098.1 MAG TPA: hypothetical protein [Caudoviricetes sp.]